MVKNRDAAASLFHLTLFYFSIAPEMTICCTWLLPS